MKCRFCNKECTHYISPNTFWGCDHGEYRIVFFAPFDTNDFSLFYKLYECDVYPDRNIVRLFRQNPLEKIIYESSFFSFDGPFYECYASHIEYGLDALGTEDPFKIIERLILISTFS